MNNQISEDVAKKLNSLSGQRKKFEEILEGVKDYPADNKDALAFILNGLNARLQEELTVERLDRYYSYILDKCGKKKTFWKVALDAIKILWRAPNPSFCYNIKELSVTKAENWIKLARGIRDYTNLLDYDHEDHI